MANNSADIKASPQVFLYGKIAEDDLTEFYLDFADLGLARACALRGWPMLKRASYVLVFATEAQG